MSSLLSLGPAVATVFVITALLQLLPQFGALLDLRQVSFAPGEHRRTRTRNTTFFYTVFLVGLLGIAASYAVGIGASMSAFGIQTDSGDDITVGATIAVATLIVVEILLLIMGAVYSRSETVNLRDLRADIERALARTSMDEPLTTVAIDTPAPGAAPDSGPRRRYTWRWMFSIPRARPLALMTWLLIALTASSLIGLVVTLMASPTGVVLVTSWGLATAFGVGGLLLQYFFARMMLLLASRRQFAVIHAKRACIEGLSKLAAIHRRQHSPRARLRYLLRGR